MIPEIKHRSQKVLNSYKKKYLQEIFGKWQHQKYCIAPEGEYYKGESV